MAGGIEKRVRDGKEQIFFKISAMPIEHFKRFKEFADLEWGGSYWHAIKFLLDWYEKTQKMFEVMNDGFERKD